MLSLAISCLTTSNLPWLRALTFQVSMQYCPLQHRSLLLPPNISTVGHHFCFGSASLFLLELFLHSSLVAYWTPIELGGSSFSVIFVPFNNVQRVIKARMLKQFVIPFSSGSHVVRNLHCNLSVLGDPTWHASIVSWSYTSLWSTWSFWLVLWLWFSLCLPPGNWG